MASTERSWISRCWVTAATPAVKQLANPNLPNLEGYILNPQLLSLPDAFASEVQPPGFMTTGYQYVKDKYPSAITATGANEVSFALQRWIDPPKYGWYSGDHHVHAAGCSHYQNPTEGVRPEDMVRQIQGEKLNVGAVLTWGPCYYYQKQFFSGHDDSLSTPSCLMHYDLEVSGFPSSHAGHLVLLGLHQQD